MKFSPYSDEETCSAPIPMGKFEAACLRTKEHSGDHIPGAGEAGEADGVRFCCRVKLEEPHAIWCIYKDKE